MPEPIVVTRQLLEEFYDSTAPSYDRVWLFRECGRRLVDLLPIKPGANVLDVAAGTGMVLLPAARRVGPHGHVTGVDISSKMLQQAQQAVLNSGLSNIDLLKMDAEHLDFPDGFFDVITCGFAIWFLPPAALDEMYRVCKPAGAIGVTVPDSTLAQTQPEKIFTQLAQEFGIELKLSRPAAFSPPEIESLLAAHGFKPQQTLQETKEHVYAGPEEFWESLHPGNRMLVWTVDQAAKARLKETYLEKLNSLMQPDGLHYIIPVIYPIARK